MTVPTHGLDPPTGMEHEVGLLFAQLEEARRQTREAIAGMSTADLDRRVPGSPHSIASHVLHVAGVEYWWVRQTILGSPIPDGVGREFAAARLDSDESRALSGHEVGYYLSKLDEVRAHTEAACWQLKNDDLDDDRRCPVDRERYTIRWILNHLCDHEAHHRGQILLLKRFGRQEAE